MCNIESNIGTEELAHMEMISAIVYQLTKNLSMEEIEASGFDKYYVDHTLGLWPQAAGGVPFNACVFQSKGDAITDLPEDMAQSRKPARPTTIFFVSFTIRKYASRFVSFAQEKLFISSALVKVFALCRINWTLRTFMLLILNLTDVNHNTLLKNGGDTRHFLILY